MQLTDVKFRCRTRYI